MPVFLKPQSECLAYGVRVKVRIIPFGIKSSKDIIDPYSGKIVIPKGGKFKADTFLKTTGNKPMYITVHNTDNIIPASGTTKSEQYSRATYPNEAMGSTRVHYYVDETETWQNLLDTEIGWHVSYGATAVANDQSIAIEIIGGDARAEDNGAKLVAYLMNKYNIPIDRVRTHKSWSGKNCPCFILPHWDNFVEKVKSYAGQNNNPDGIDDRPNIAKKNWIMLSRGVAAIRTKPSKNGEMIGRVTKDYYYAFSDRIVNTSNEIWFKHDGTPQRYSMYKDGVILFTQVGVYKKGKTTAKLNMRKSPTTSAEVLTVIPKNEIIYVIDQKNEIKCDGFTWRKVMYNNKFLGYVAEQYIKV